MRYVIQSFATVEQILRDRIGHLAEIGRHKDLSSKIVDMLIATLLGLSLFGLAMGATVALLLTAQTVTAILNLGFALISLFFHFSGSDYPFMVVLSVVMLAVSGSTGLIFLVQGALYLE